MRRKFREAQNLALQSDTKIPQSKLITSFYYLSLLSNSNMLQFASAGVFLCTIVMVHGLDQSVMGYIPNLTLEELENIVDNPTRSLLRGLLDNGGKMGAIQVNGMGHEYKNALENFIVDGPECIELMGDNDIEVLQMPDSSYRKTYATMDGRFPDCFKHQTLSNAFDEVDRLIMKLISKIIMKSSSMIPSELSYSHDGYLDSLNTGINKEHIHVYVTNSSTSAYMVPFHVDNGIYLILTPFPGHGLKLKLSDNKIVSTDGFELDSTIVLFGRGLTEWLLQNDEKMRDQFHAVPHSVPSMMPDKMNQNRAVYARMKVVKSSAIPVIREERADLLALKTFQEVFMESRETPISEPRYNDLCPMSNSAREQEIWLRNMKQQCDDGEAFCWMNCLPLPDECPNEEDAMCTNENTEPCFDDSMDPTCSWHCK